MGMEKCGNYFKYVYREKSFYCRQQDALQVRQQKLPKYPTACLEKRRSDIEPNAI